MTYELDEHQLAAVQAPRDARVGVLAAAGSGKTTVLTHRAAWLMSQGIPASRMLVVTFSRNATRELSERLQPMVRRMPEVSTFHAWAASLLRRHADLIGRSRSFSVLSREDSDDILRMCASDLRVSVKRISSLRKKPEVMTLYRRRLAEGDALEMDDVLGAATTLLQRYPDETRYDAVLVDEAQDLNALQWGLVHAVADRLFAVGDSRQCQPAGTQVLTPDGPRAIETLVDGDLVCPWDRRGAHVFTHLGQKARIASRNYTGRMYTISYEGKTTETTGDHRWLVRWSDSARTLYGVYLMRKNGKWRIGWCKILDESNGCRAAHYKLRARLEKADAIYIVHVAQTAAEASKWESVWSAKYGILTVMFMARKSAKLYSQDALDWMFEQQPGEEGALRLLSKTKRDVRYPLWEHGASRGGRQTLFEVRACNLMQGMAIPVWDGRRTYTWEEPKVTSLRVKATAVYSLDVEKYHTYVADGICTLNCIYQWRGAEPDLFDEFRDSEHVLSLTLPTNYRSVPAIVTAANAVQGERWSPVDAHRQPSGPGPVTFAVGDPEAAWVATMCVAGMQGKPSVTRWGDVAVLARTWRELADVHAVLVSRGIPSQFCGPGQDMWETEVGRTLARWLLLALHPMDDNLVALLAPSIAPAVSLARARARAIRSRCSLNAVLVHMSPAWSEMFHSLCRLTLPNIDLNQSPATAYQNERELIPLAELDALKVAATFIGSWSPAAPGISALLSSLDGLTMADWERWYIFERREQDRAGGGVDGVHLLTVHAAKGLEWPMVIVMGAAEQQWPRPGEWTSSEARRLMYVALTRARDVLVVIKHRNSDWSRYIQDIQGVRR